jgi:hypothetical protein
LPLFAIWANTHGGFVAGLVLLGASFAVECGLTIFTPEAVDKVTARRKAAVFGATLAGSFFATLVNPYGVTLYAHVFQLLGNSYFMNLHAEWKSPQFHGAGAFQFEGLMLLFPLLLAVSRRRPNAVELALSLLLFHFALTGLRYLPLWILVVTPLLARSAAGVPALAAAVSRLKQSGQGGNLFSVSVGPARWSWTLAATLLLVAGSRLVEGRVSRILPEIIPTAPLDRLLALHSRTPDAVVFHSYNWGGYLTWHGWKPVGSGFQNWIDDRNEVQGQGHVEAYFATLNAEPGWQERLDRGVVAIVCIPPDAPLANRLAESPIWAEVDRDEFAVTFVRRSGVLSSGSVAADRGSR